MSNLSKRDLAKYRNSNKWLLSGSYKPYNKEALLPVELELIQEINNLRKRLIANWDNNSKLLGLKVPEHRCYFPNCRGKVVVKFESGNYACKKHLKENPNSKYEIIN